jgi:hypothetical protein
MGIELIGESIGDLEKLTLRNRRKYVYICLLVYKCIYVCIYIGKCIYMVARLFELTEELFKETDVKGFHSKKR